ncbi:uncharacterized protein BYT42DRAFT_647590 [Radiomyces spectabilis]|uniref:uncharacterized protein n=1 Tax=Radiomyces spectabilis TaxID=64574 RepID=UPI0022206D74|nr:uncharacterized protein BYT42DRAFT_647590 [Radiomyces spectabilis]KAI8370331.1 hypothetical protein BYT42DRAFT_647590 [Radiomyces spectabilis]
MKPTSLYFLLPLVFHLDFPRQAAAVLLPPNARHQSNVAAFVQHSQTQTNDQVSSRISLISSERRWNVVTGSLANARDPPHDALFYREPLLRDIEIGYSRDEPFVPVNGNVPTNGHPPALYNHLQKRGNGSTFTNQPHNGAAFNIIHVMAAVLGIIAATIVTIVVFIMYRRRRRRQARRTDDTEKSASSMVGVPHLSSPSPAAASTRLTQFVNNYYYDERQHAVEPDSNPLNTNISSDTASGASPTIVTPSMQQYRLQLKLLQRHDEQRQKQRPHPGPPSRSSQPLDPPPPPYEL